ncbi:MAG: 4Fe-4S binding protein [Proteobacteria bacterium]|nr:4Fe-4S binding protein [Pseudomonadota bacterium]MCP4919819.1 4Fe-4S binding protein [Pseudomonadota bacterium]
MSSLLWMWVWLAVVWAGPTTQHITGRDDVRSHGLDCSTDPCAAVLPGAVRFDGVEGKPYAAGYDAADAVVGWVVLSTDVTDVKAYSGKPVITLVGLDREGNVAGAQVVHHSEPILLVGIPEQELHDFVSAHVGFRADDKVVLGGGAEDAHSVDAISGATVTVLAETRTIMETARQVAEDVGVISVQAAVPGHFVEDEPWSWEEMLDEGALGHLRVTQDEMGLEPDPEGRPFIDLYFAIADAPQVGIPLLGEGTWKWAVGELGEGEHLFVLFNTGSYSFKGSGFVRGGIFDRFKLEQGLRTLSFRDMDYTKLSSPDAEGAPEFWEGGLFIARDAQLDPGLRFDLVFLGSSYALDRGAFERDFKSFSVDHRTPRSVYVLDGPDPESMIWRQAWAQGWPKALFVGLYLFAVALLFVFRGWMTARMQRLKNLHTVFAFMSFLVLGLALHVQPSVTQVMTFFGSLGGDWDWGLFLSDPVLFVSWIGLAITSILWGRGVFCGWVCPFGAMAELQFKLGRLLKLPNLELPDAVHDKLKYLRYLVAAGLVVTFLFDAELGERLAEVEPFKSTFFVPIWTRHPGLIVWWLLLFSSSFTTYRPFCRYLCPLGAALAVPSSVRLSGPYRRDFCSKCKICTRGCEPRAIRPDGTIDPRECLNCWECEVNYGDDKVCPPLVKIRRDRERAAK